MPYTTPYPGPRSVLILDNCSIHHAEEVCTLVEDENCMFRSLLCYPYLRTNLCSVQARILTRILTGLQHNLDGILLYQVVFAAAQ